MKIIPSINLIFYLFIFLALLLLIVTLVVLLRSKHARKVKALFFGGACCLQLVTIASPIYLYSNKPAPLASPCLLIGVDQHYQIVALNARDGSVRWTHQAQTLSTNGSGNVFYTSDINNRGSIITAWTASSGTQIWQTSLQANGMLEYLMGANGFVYVDVAMGWSDEVVYALRATDGKLTWKHTIHLRSGLGDARNPLLITAGNGLVFVRAQESSFSVLHANDGSLAWHFSPNIPQGRFVYNSQLVLVGQNVYYLQDLAGDQGVSLFAFSQGNGKPLWQRPLQGSSNYASGLAGAGTHLYLSINGQIIVLNALNGTQLWHSPLYMGRTFMVIEARGIAYIPGNGALNALDERNGKILWSLDADPDGNFTELVLSQNVLFASARAIAPHIFNPGSGQDAVVAIDPAHGSVYWSTTNAARFIGIFNLF
ncbi:PQQ-like beta-propeller repeat protein [Ktedonospora formicarum]|uniref:Pyrrolo-quinoline quinone repeat domain-containing protein n=1 Tax=Ktedonospora formicarum TaxID=2778364 RepID=A0A8J3MYX0_9CHLR|nr:PQQ-like beta-propeller repeat protein [Ktedonospora formicarum]GHO51371.1 hypothetical protein KSX_95340 [Ktedonospora formicarum]